jgi:hypothetical protein
VVVLDQNAVAVTEAMIDAATRAHGGISSTRMSGVVLRVSIVMRPAAAHELARQRCDARHPLHEVERGSLRGEQRRGPALNLGDPTPGSDREPSP